MKALIAMIAVALVVALVGVADADDEPAVAHVGEANLESKEVRQGVQLTGAIGGGLALGFSMEDTTGTGGVISLRLGEPMTPQWVLTIELAGGGQLHRTAEMNPRTVIDNDTNLLFGAQFYPSDSFFVRGGFGLGTYLQNTAARDLADHKYVGPAFVLGAGLELVKLKHFIFDFEVFSISMPNRAGLLATTAACLGLTIH